MKKKLHSTIFHFKQEGDFSVVSTAHYCLCRDIVVVVVMYFFTLTQVTGMAAPEYHSRFLGGWAAIAMGMGRSGPRSGPLDQDTSNVQ